MEDWILLAVAMLATGCVAGVLAGLFGIGGGIVIVPVLEAVLGFLGVDPAIRMHVAVATSLATIIPTSISSARAHHRRGAVDVQVVKRWAVFVLVGLVLPLVSPLGVSPALMCDLLRGLLARFAPVTGVGRERGHRNHRARCVDSSLP